MSRERFIDPGMWTSAQFLRLSCPEAKLLWIGVITTADDEGRGAADPWTLLARIFPGSGYNPDQVALWRNELVASRLIRVYCDEAGAEIYDIPAWSNFQKPRHIKRSRYPAFPGAARSAAAAWTLTAGPWMNRERSGIASPTPLSAIPCRSTSWAQ